MIAQHCNIGPFFLSLNRIGLFFDIEAHWTFLLTLKPC